MEEGTGSIREFIRWLRLHGYEICQQEESETPGGTWGQSWRPLRPARAERLGRNFLSGAAPGSAQPEQGLTCLGCGAGLGPGAHRVQGHAFCDKCYGA